MTSVIAIFQGIAEQIDEDLIDSQPIAEEPGMLPCNIFCKMKLLFHDLCFQKRLQSCHQLCQITFLHDKLHLTALDLGHIQDIIDQSEKIIG